MPLSEKYSSLTRQIAAGAVVVRELRRLAYDYAPGADPAVTDLARNITEHVETLRANPAGRGPAFQSVRLPEGVTAAGREGKGAEKDAACADTLVRLDLALVGLQAARRA